MDSKLFWINRKSFFLFFLLTSSSWNPPKLFSSKRPTPKGAKCPVECPGACQLSWAFYLALAAGGFEEFAGGAGVRLWRQLQAWPCWRQCDYSRRHPSSQRDQSGQGKFFPYHHSQGSCASGLWARPSGEQGRDHRLGPPTPWGSRPHPPARWQKRHWEVTVRTPGFPS